MAPNNNIPAGLLIRATRRMMISGTFKKVGSAIGVPRLGGWMRFRGTSSSCSTPLCYDSYTKCSCCPADTGCKCV